MGERAAWAGVVATPENRSALAAAGRALRAAAEPGASRLAGSPVVFHGPPGTGKTLLVTALLRRVAGHPAGLSARSVPARELPRAKSDDPDGDAAAAVAELLALDLLAVEDVQHLPARGVPGLIDLIDHRSARRRVTVVTATAGPAHLAKLPRRLTSRLAAGLVVQLEPPGRSSRGRLLRHHADAAKLQLTDDAVEALLDHTAGDGVRPMLGVLTLLKSLGRDAGVLDADAVRRLLAGGPDAETPVARIVRRVAAAYGVSAAELLGRSRRGFGRRPAAGGDVPGPRDDAAVAAPHRRGTRRPGPHDRFTRLAKGHRRRRDRRSLGQDAAGVAGGTGIGERPA